MSYIKKSKIKEEIKKRGFRIGDMPIKDISNKLNKTINIYLDKTTRNALTSGRKTIKKEDIQELI